MAHAPVVSAPAACESVGVNTVQAAMRPKKIDPSTKIQLR
jgi:hypothetical protein